MNSAAFENTYCRIENSQARTGGTPACRPMAGLTFRHVITARTTRKSGIGLENRLRNIAGANRKHPSNLKTVLRPILVRFAGRG